VEDMAGAASNRVEEIGAVMEVRSAAERSQYLTYRICPAGSDFSYFGSA